MVTHDVNARALSPKVKNFVQAKNWFQDSLPSLWANDAAWPRSVRVPAQAHDARTCQQQNPPHVRTITR